MTRDQMTSAIDELRQYAPAHLCDALEAELVAEFERLTARVAELEKCQPIVLSEPTAEERLLRREDAKTRRAMNT